MLSTSATSDQLIADVICRHHVTALDTLAHADMKLTLNGLTNSVGKTSFQFVRRSVVKEIFLFFLLLILIKDLINVDGPKLLTSWRTSHK